MTAPTFSLPKAGGAVFEDAFEAEVQRCLDGLDASIPSIEALRMLHRPGDVPAAFHLNVGATNGVIATNPDGKVVRYAGAGIIRSRVRVSLESGRRWEFRFAGRRNVNSSDPSNDAIRLKIRFERADGSVIETVTLESLRAQTVQAGRFNRSFLISRVPGEVSAAWVEGARYAVAEAQVYGSDQTTDIEVCGGEALPWAGETATTVAIARHKLTHRPGDFPEGFDLSAGGFDPGVPVVNVNGAAIRLSGRGRILGKAPVALESGRRYELRFAGRRHLDSPDPSNDAVRLYVRFFDKDGVTILGNRTLETITGLKTTDGRFDRAFIIERVAGADSAAWVPGANYALPLAETFGIGHQTDIEICDIAEMPPSLAGPQGATGPQGGDSLIPGPSGPPGAYFGPALIGASDDIASRPVSASEGDAWGLLVGGVLQISIWVDGGWVDTLSPASAQYSDGLSVWTVKLTGDGTAGPYSIGWDGPIVGIMVGPDFLSASQYSRSGGIVTFSAPVAEGAAISAICVTRGPGVQVTPLDIVGDGTTGPYAVPADSVLFLHAAGSFIGLDAYSVSGSTLTFAASLAVGVHAQGVAVSAIHHRDVPGVYSSRADAVASSVPAGLNVIQVLHNGVRLTYRSDAVGTALVTLGGHKWSPAGDTPSPLHYGAPCDGSDDAPYWTACGLENGRAYGLGATYTFLTGCAWPRGHHVRLIDLTDTTLILDPAMGFIPAFTVRGSGLTSTYGGENVIATVTADLAAKARTIPIIMEAGAVAIGIGDTLLIKSAEYWSGVTDKPGYGVQTKGELAIVSEVASGSIKVLTPIRDSYDNAGYPVSLYRLHMLDGVTIRGGDTCTIHGRDQNIGGAGDALVETYPSVVRIEFARDVTISGLRTEGFVAAQCVTAHCVNVDCSENTFRGPAVNAANLPEPTVYRSKGLDAISCESVRFVNNHGFRLRAPVDFQSAPSFGICQNATVIGGSAMECWRPWTTHMVRTLTAVGQVSRTLQAFYFRGQDATVVANAMTVYTDGDAAHFGHAPTNAVHAEEPNMGDIVYSDNIVDCGGADAFRIAGSFRSFTCEGNTLRNVRHGGEVWAKRIGSLSYRRNKVISREAMDAAATSYGFIIANHPNVPLVELGNVDISDNDFIGRWGYAIRIMGTMTGAGARRVKALRNNFGSVRLQGISFQSVAPGNAYGESGNFAVSPFVADNTFDVEPPALIVHPAGGGFAAVTGTRRMGGPQYVATVGVASGDPLLAVSYGVGMRDLYAVPVAGGFEGRVCTAAGTGLALSGVTGAIASGSPTMTVSSADAIFVGAYLTVAGSGLAAGARVIAKNGNVLTMSGNAASTVAGAAVAYQAPTFKGFGAVQA